LIPLAGSFFSFSFIYSDAHPASSLTAQGYRRAPQSAAAVRHRATPSLLLSACALAGELRLALERAVRAFSCSFRPHLTIPPLAVTAVSRRPRAAHVLAESSETGTSEFEKPEPLGWNPEPPGLKFRNFRVC